MTRPDDREQNPADGVTQGEPRRARFAPSSAAPPEDVWLITKGDGLRNPTQSIDENATRAVKLRGEFGPRALRYVPAWVDSLDLSECWGLTAAMFDDLAPLGLTSLDVSGHPIGKWKATAALAQLHTLTSLTANRCDLGDADLEVIATLPNLTSVSLRRNSIGLRGVEIILQNHRLRHIDFADNEVGTFGALAIAEDDVVRSWIGMKGNHVGTVGTDALKRRMDTGGVAISGISSIPG
ncbi:protein phosphatase 1 regulatory subunit 42 [Trinickia sp. LjRoot230]|uniref:hypothetical protein n=1 Tax=Trinickia sp. LjRoot230 TaxID=3342288 RepID=UPI003ECD3038